MRQCVAKLKGKLWIEVQFPLSKSHSNAPHVRKIGRKFCLEGGAPKGPRNTRDGRQCGAPMHPALCAFGRGNQRAQSQPSLIQFANHACTFVGEVRSE